MFINKFRRTEFNLGSKFAEPLYRVMNLNFRNDGPDSVSYFFKVNRPILDLRQAILFCQAELVVLNGRTDQRLRRHTAKVKAVAAQAWFLFHK